jgi:hypothetical protein
MSWLCKNISSIKYGFEGYQEDRPKECEICGFKDKVEIHHIIPLGKDGDHCKENVALLCPNHHAEVEKGKLILDREGKYIENLKERKEKLAKFSRLLVDYTFGRLNFEENEELIKLSKEFSREEAIALNLGISVPQTEKILGKEIEELKSDEEIKKEAMEWIKNEKKR